MTMRSMPPSSLWIKLILSLLASTSSITWAQAQPTQEAPDHSAFDGILQANVQDEKVDYLLVRRDHADSLNQYLEAMATVSPEHLSKEEALAYYFNLYNATMIKAIIDRYHFGYQTDSESFGVFDEPLVRLKEKRVSLNQLEHEILRKKYNEPRLHAALVCGARSCPPLIARAYRSDDLDSVLESNMKTFVRDPFRNQMDTSSKTLKLSKIFEWYGDDFGGSSGLKATLSRYLDQDVEDYKVEYLPYSWKLNILPPQKGRWVITLAPHAFAEKEQPAGQVLEVLEESDGKLRVVHASGAESWIPVSATKAWKI